MNRQPMFQRALIRQGNPCVLTPERGTCVHARTTEGSRPAARHCQFTPREETVSPVIVPVAAIDNPHSLRCY